MNSRITRVAAVAVGLSLSAPGLAATFRIELDYMLDLSPGDIHSHRPDQAELDAVIQMFACHGHTLIIEVSSVLPHYDVLLQDPNPDQTQRLSFFAYAGADNSFGKLKQDWFNHAGQPGWHYCIFAHQYESQPGTTSSSSGLGETPGDDFIVTMGSFAGQIGTPFDRASTLAHEFGHNLGLTHCIGAGANCDNSANPNWIGQFQLNQASIMSYFFQLQGVRSNLLCQGLIPQSASALFKELDYSNGYMCSLNEASLSETFGTGMKSVDWNCNGAVSGTVAHDLNGNSSGWCAAASGLQTVIDGNEWASLTDVALTRSVEDLDNMPVTACITAEESEIAARSSCAQPGIVSEPCIGGRILFVAVGSGGPQSGKCIEPLHTLTAAHSIATSGSGLFFVGGTFFEPGSVLITTPMTLNSVGTSLISPP